MRNKKYLPVISIAIVLLLSLFTFLELSNRIDIFRNDSNSSSQQGPTPEQKQEEDAANAEKKKALIDKSPDTSAQSPTTSSERTLDLSAKQEPDNTVTIFTKLAYYSSGTCEIQITNGGKSTAKTAKVIYHPEGSACAGFSIPIDSLGKGSWSIILIVTSEGQQQTKTISFGVE